MKPVQPLYQTAKKKAVKKAKEPAQTGGQGALLKELWNAAVSLRGNIEPADYKRYVLPLIFLRFLSLRYEKRRGEIDSEMADPASDIYTTDPQMQFVLREEPDRYLEKNVFLVPEEARWENIVKIARADDVKLQLDKIMGRLEEAFPKLKGLLPPIYAGSNLDRENVAGLVNLFSKEIFRGDGGGIDMLCHTWDCFLVEFANSEGKRAGDLWSLPPVFRELMVAMLEPTHGKVFDPCCGCGGMFVQSDVFAQHSRKLSFYGQEAKDFTYRLCRLNLFIHGLDGNIALGSSYTNDQHADLKADYILAAPPFNDGAKGDQGWGADKIPKDDARLRLPGSATPQMLAPRNANTLWMLHFLQHLQDHGPRSTGGTAAFVMATGELSNSELARLSVRKALVESGYVDCVVTLTSQLFANTQIPCALWFLSKNRPGGHGYRKRSGEVLFIDGRKLGSLIPGSRKQKQLSDDDIERIAAVYRQFKRESAPEPLPGFCAVASLEKIREAGYALTPGRYVGASEDGGEDEPFEERFPKLKAQIERCLSDGEKLSNALRAAMNRVES